jgi:hypothetical protein
VTDACDVVCVQSELEADSKWISIISGCG